MAALHGGDLAEDRQGVVVSLVAIQKLPAEPVGRLEVPGLEVFDRLGDSEVLLEACHGWSPQRRQSWAAAASDRRKTTARGRGSL